MPSKISSDEIAHLVEYLTSIQEAKVQSLLGVDKYFLICSYLNLMVCTRYLTLEDFAYKWFSSSVGRAWDIKAEVPGSIPILGIHFFDMSFHPNSNSNWLVCSIYETSEGSVYKWSSSSVGKALDIKAEVPSSIPTQGMYFFNYAFHPNSNSNCGGKHFFLHILSYHTIGCTS